MPRRLKDWTLAQESFERLLRLLDPDRERAGAQYERIRAKLTKFFQWQGCAAPEDYADKTLDRVARTIDQGTDVRAADPYTYFYGVALNLLHEYRRDPLTGAQPLAEEPAATERPPSDDERRLACLDDCMTQLPAATRRQLLEYHGGEGRSRIQGRQQLATSLGIPLNALRIRMFRIRVELEDCIVACMGNAAPAAGLKYRWRFRH